MTKRTVYILFAVFLLIPWVSQYFYPYLSIWEAVGFNAGTIVLFVAILRWGKV